MSIAALGLASVVLAVPAPKHNIGDIHKHHFNGTKVSWVHPTTAGPRGTGACSDYSPEESEVPKKKRCPRMHTQALPLLLIHHHHLLHHRLLYHRLLLIPRVAKMQWNM